jgi:hypothetical protein
MRELANHVYRPKQWIKVRQRDGRRRWTWRSPMTARIANDAGGEAIYAASCADQEGEPIGGVIDYHEDARPMPPDIGDELGRGAICLRLINERIG